MTRLRWPILPHLDLLRPARRVWTSYLADCRLATLEREVVGRRARGRHRRRPDPGALLRLPSLAPGGAAGPGACPQPGRHPDPGGATRLVRQGADVARGPVGRRARRPRAALGAGGRRARARRAIATRSPRGSPARRRRRCASIWRGGRNDSPDGMSRARCGKRRRAMPGSTRARGRSWPNSTSTVAAISSPPAPSSRTRWDSRRMPAFHRASVRRSRTGAPASTVAS